MQKVGLRIIGVSFIFTLIFIGIAIGLAQWRQSILEDAPPINLDTASIEQLNAIAVQFDNNGVGTQVIDNTALTFKISPYPPQTNAPITLTLIALNTRLNTLATITPTLVISPQDSANANEQAIQRQTDGTYRAVFTLPQSGGWRLRVNYSQNSNAGYSALLLVKTR